MARKFIDVDTWNSPKKAIGVMANVQTNRQYPLINPSDKLTYVQWTKKKHKWQLSIVILIFQGVPEIRCVLCEQGWIELLEAPSSGFLLSSFLF